MTRDTTSSKSINDPTTLAYHVRRPEMIMTTQKPTKRLKLFVLLAIMSLVAAFLAAHFGNILVCARAATFTPFELMHLLPDVFLPAVVISPNALLVFITASLASGFVWWLQVQTSIWRATGRGALIGSFYALGTILLMYVDGSLKDAVPGFTKQAYAILAGCGLAGVLLCAFAKQLPQNQTIKADE